MNELNADAREWIEERAAILEFEGGMDRDVANWQAVEMWLVYGGREDAAL